jgi:hypothetical protein
MQSMSNFSNEILTHCSYCDSSDDFPVSGRFLVGCRFLPHTPTGPAQDGCQLCEFYYLFQSANHCFCASPLNRLKSKPAYFMICVRE